MSSQTATLIPMMICEVSAGFAVGRPPYAVRTGRVERAPSWTQAGHWKPTAAGFMQSGQIGRPHR